MEFVVRAAVTTGSQDKFPKLVFACSHNIFRLCGMLWHQPGESDVYLKVIYIIVDKVRELVMEDGRNER